MIFGVSWKNRVGEPFRPRRLMDLATFGENFDTLGEKGENGGELFVAAFFRAGRKGGGLPTRFWRKGSPFR